MKELFNYSLFLLLILATSLQTAAQTNLKDKWAAGIVVSSDYAYRRLKADGFVDGWKELSDELERPKFGYTTGFAVLYRLNQWFEMESGLLFSDKGLSYKVPGEGGWVIPESGSSDDWEINDPALPLEATTTYNYRYLNVPLKMNWFFLQKKVRLFLSAGISTSIFLNEVTVQKAKFPGRTETSRFNEEDVDYNPVLLSLTGGAGIEYPLSDRLHIRLNPEYRHAVTPLADTPGRYYLWSAGMNTGVFFRL